MIKECLVDISQLGLIFAGIYFFTINVWFSVIKVKLPFCFIKKREFYTRKKLARVYVYIVMYSQLDLSTCNLYGIF